MSVFFLIAVLGIVPVLTADTQESSADQAWAGLNKALTSPNPDHRRQALSALGSIGASNHLAVQKVIEGLKDKDPQVRRTAATVIGDMKAKDAISALEAALDDNDEVAVAAAMALAAMGDDRGRGVLVAVLEGERKDAPGLITSKWREAKHKLRHPETLAFMGAEEATGALFGPASMGLVVAHDVLKDGGAAGRAIAANYLAKDSDPYALALLEWALGDSNWGVRAAAARGVGEHGNAASIPKLEPVLNDGHTGARTMAAAAIIRILDREESAITSRADRAKQ